MNNHYDQGFTSSRTATSKVSAIMRKLFALLLLCLSSTVMFAQDLHYTVSTDGCASTNTIMTGLMYIDYVEQKNDNLEIGVFDQDGICRGAKRPVYRAQTDQYIYSIIIHGNDGFAYPTFKIYDHETGTELDLILDIEEEITWESNKKYGSLANPYPINFTYPSEPCYEPEDVTVSDITESSATVAWEDPYGDAWQIMLNDDEDNLIDVSENPFTLTGLTPGMTYSAQVRTKCSDSDYSDWTDAVSFTTTSDILTIGSSDGTNAYLPLNNYYNYSLTEQIYTAEELGEAGVIERIGFFKKHNKSCERDIDIYMVYTDKSEFESTSDWITVTEHDRVFSGTVSFDDYSWTDITLDEPFVYDGLHNVVIVVDDNTGEYNSTTNFAAFPTEGLGQALYQYSDGTNFDPTGTLIDSRDLLNQKNQLRILKSEFTDCMKPIRLVTTEVGPDLVVLDWDEIGTADSWLVTCNEETIETNEHPFTLTGLAPETEYTITVSPACDPSLKSRTLTFTTLVACPTPFNVEVSDITCNSANVAWTGYSESYTVHYRTAPTIVQTFLSEGFEGAAMPDGWTVEGDTQDEAKTWRVGVGDSQETTGTHSGNYNALITHDTGGSETYLITPAMNLAGQSNLRLSFWYTNRVWSGDIDGFGVCYREGESGEWNELWSTTEEHATWTFQSISLTGLPDNCQIGFRMTDSYGRGVGLDDILIGIEQIGEWESLTATASPQALTGLIPGTEYEVFITPVCDENAVSETVTFTTGPVVEIELADDADNTSTIADNDGSFANVTLSGRTLYKDGAWNTLTLPFNYDLTVEGNVLAGATLMELDTENEYKGHVTGLDGTTLYLNFKNAENGIRAGVPYIISWTKPAPYVPYDGTNAELTSDIVNPVFSSVEIVNGAPTVVESTDQKVSFQGCYTPVSFNEETPSILFVGGNNTLYYPQPTADNPTITIGAFRAYFQVAAGSEVRSFSLKFGDNSKSNGIMTMSYTKKAEGWYTFDGRKLLNAPKRKGVYIHNGVKVTIK